MKSLFMLLFTVGTLITGVATSNDIQETQTVEATFAGFVDGEYHFATADSKISFQEIDAMALTTAQLSEKAAVGKKFTITYTVSEEEDEGGEITEVKTITKLEPAK